MIEKLILKTQRPKKNRIPMISEAVIFDNYQSNISLLSGTLTLPKKEGGLYPVL